MGSTLGGGGSSNGHVRDKRGIRTETTKGNGQGGHSLLAANNFITHWGACRKTRVVPHDRRPRTRPKGADAVEPSDHERVRPSRPPLTQSRPGADRRRRAALRGHRGEPRAVDRRPVRPTRCRAPGARRRRPASAGPGYGDPPTHRSSARAASVRSGHLPRTHDPHGRPRARLRRTVRPHRQRGSSAGDRLALPRGRAVLRSHPRRSDGSGQPPQVPLDPRPDQRLLGRGVHRRRVRRDRRARRSLRLHRQPGRGPVGPHAGRARHHRGRPGRHHPGGISRRTRRRRRSGHGQDRRRPAPRGVPPLLRPSPRPRAGPRAVHRSAPALPGLHRRRPPEPRRGGRADLHRAGPHRRGSHGDDRGRPGRRPPEVVRGHGQGDRGGRRYLRAATHPGDDGHDRPVRHLAERRGLDRGVRCTGPRYAAQRGARADLGRAAHDPGGQARRAPRRRRR